MTTPFTLFAATVTGVQNNNHYPNQNVVMDAASLSAVAGFDHVVATPRNHMKVKGMLSARPSTSTSQSTKYTTRMNTLG
ncbi:hypothetical protein [Alloscardovia sp. HMSC034E08]|uniref:hypothetical protein n=1 Tax=Alloscardovia sp. HMSC034E08 TaxID=1739413 RepID=UPI0008BA5FC2|nr:hypothetical protein [Alloscardovia sp. HMSC034E08]OFR00325.1 hypothetical protein HMPREF2909_04405 [Alloscardovia sp. HMSC034E08]